MRVSAAAVNIARTARRSTSGSSAPRQPGSSAQLLRQSLLKELSKEGYALFHGRSLPRRLSRRGAVAAAAASGAKEGSDAFARGRRPRCGSVGGHALGKAGCCAGQVA